MDILKLDSWRNTSENYTGIVEDGYGTIVYYLNGELHREDGPAVIWKDGRFKYFLNGKIHREDGPAAIHLNGIIEYCINGKLHREDGPAFTWPDVSLEYWLNGKLHREEGPAIIWDDGREEWFLNDNNITKEVKDWIKENNIPKVWNKSHKILFKLTFG